MTHHTSRRATLAAAVTLGGSALILSSAAALGAQSMPGAAAKRAAQNAVAATNAHTQAMTSPAAGGPTPAAGAPTTIPGQSPAPTTTGAAKSTAAKPATPKGARRASMAPWMSWLRQTA